MNAGGPVPGGGESDHSLGVAVLFRRGQRTSGVASFWLAFGYYGCYRVIDDAASQGSPAPAWFDHLELAFGVAAVVSVAVFFGCSVALRRRPAELRAQAAAVDREQLRQSRRVAWYRLILTVIIWAALWLAAPLTLGIAVMVGGPLAVNGFAYLFGAGQVFTWSSGDMEVHSAGSAAGAVAIGLLFVLTAVGYLWAVYLIVRRRWWRDITSHLARSLVG